MHERKEDLACFIRVVADPCPEYGVVRSQVELRERARDGVERGLWKLRPWIRGGALRIAGVRTVDEESVRDGTARGAGHRDGLERGCRTHGRARVGRAAAGRYRRGKRE